jgi:hypothetical protein
LPHAKGSSLVACSSLQTQVIPAHVDCKSGEKREKNLNFGANEVKTYRRRFSPCCHSATKMASYEDDPWDDDEEEYAQGTYEFSPEDVVATARCMYDFDSTNDVELAMKVRWRHCVVPSYILSSPVCTQEGDIINITRLDVGGKAASLLGLNHDLKSCLQGGWLEGELNGRHGLFPESYVEVVGDIATSCLALTS